MWVCLPMHFKRRNSILHGIFTMNFKLEASKLQFHWSYLTRSLETTVGNLCVNRDDASNRPMCSGICNFLPVNCGINDGSVVVVLQTRSWHMFNPPRAICTHSATIVVIIVSSSPVVVGQGTYHQPARQPEAWTDPVVRCLPGLGLACVVRLLFLYGKSLRTTPQGRSEWSGSIPAQQKQCWLCMQMY